MSLCILVCVCVCVCNSLKEHVVANSALYVVTVNGRDAPKYILGWNREFWMCLVENQNRKCFVIIIYFIKYYKVIL